MNLNLRPHFITHKMRITNSSDVLSPTMRMVQCTGLALLVTFGLGLTGCSDNQPTSPSEPATNSEPASETTTPADSTATVSTETAPADTDMGTEPPVTDVDTETSEDVSETTTATEDAPAANEPELSADAGKQLYESHCQQCHQGGLLGAPKYGDKAAWQPHISKGMATLYEHSAKGFNKMPPQAVNGVTDAQVHAAVDYMVAGSS